MSTDPITQTEAEKARAARGSATLTGMEPGAAGLPGCPAFPLGPRVGPAGAGWSGCRGSGWAGRDGVQGFPGVGPGPVGG